MALALTLAPPARAQTAEIEGPDYLVWEVLAELAESALENRNASDEELTALRAEVDAARARFQMARDANQDRISILREQIDALGAPPAEGESEAPEIAERRADLTERLARREAPLRAADEAFRRAEAIIRAIDRVLRERQADALMTLWPTPLNPANWVEGANALISSGLTVYGEAYNQWLDPARREALRADLPVILGALLLAVLMLARGRRWMEQLTTRLLLSTALFRGRVVAAFVLSLAQLLVPFLGLSLLSLAIVLTGLTGPTIEALAETLVASGMAFFIARWLALQIFPIVEDPGLPLRLTPEQRRQGRFLAMILGILAAFEYVYEPLLSPSTQSPAANAVVIFPLIVLASLTLFRFARLILMHHPLEAEGAGGGVMRDLQPASFFDRLLRLGGKGVVVLSVAAPLLAAVGYVAAALNVVFPLIGTLALVAFVVILHRLVTAIYEAITGEPEGASEGLIPALAGMLLAVGSLPFIALTWGVRETELLEIWQQFREGFRIGDARISPANLVSFILVFIIGFLLTRGMQGALATSVLPRTTMEKGAQKAIVSGVGYVGIVVAALVAFSTAGIDLSGLAIVAGALSVGIGFGLQNIVSNFVSGLILLIERPVSEGDWVQVGETSGFVQRISVRSTVIETFDRTEVIVPNADLISGSVTNYTKSNRTGRTIVKVGVAYGTDTRRIEKLLTEIAEAHDLVSLSPPPGVLFMGFGADALEFEIRAILTDVNFVMRVKSDLNHEIARRFAEEGIEIPFAQRDLWLRNPEVLRPDWKPPAGAAAAAGVAAGVAGAAALAAGAGVAASPLRHDATVTNAPEESDGTDAEDNEE